MLSPLCLARKYKTKWEFLTVKNGLAYYNTELITVKISLIMQLIGVYL
jgi:hypothetical protein